MYAQAIHLIALQEPPNIQLVWSQSCCVSTRYDFHIHFKHYFLNFNILLQIVTGTKYSMNSIQSNNLSNIKDSSPFTTYNIFSRRFWKHISKTLNNLSKLEYHNWWIGLKKHCHKRRYCSLSNFFLCHKISKVACYKCVTIRMYGGKGVKAAIIDTKGYFIQ